jgi:hydrogenase-4 component B
MYLAELMMVLIGLFPSAFISFLRQPLFLFVRDLLPPTSTVSFDALSSLYKINYLGLGFILLIIFVIFLRKFLSRNATVSYKSTWGCAYPLANPKMQYTANSFVRSYTKLAKPFLDIGKHEVHITEVFPPAKHYETQPYDMLERYLIDKPLKLIKVIIGWFLFLQNGRLQAYILYGITFILLVICIPLFFDKIVIFLQMLNHL